MGTENEEQLKSQINKTLEWVRKHPIVFMGILLLFALVSIIVYWAIWADISPQWTGFGAYDEQVNGPRSKTLWDWMQLLLIPIILAIAGFWFSHTQRQAELEISEKAREEERKLAEQARNTELQIALDRQQQQTLENYLDRMKELLLDRNLGPDAAPEVKRLARTWTLNILRELTAKRNMQIIQFLQESNLIGEKMVVDLSNANLEGVDLCEVDLSHTNFEGVDLKRANLNGANLNEANLSKTVLQGAKLVGTNLSKANLSGANLNGADLNWATLQEAKLVEANLVVTDLSTANLSNAKLNRAILQGADLKAADLEGADLSEATYNTTTQWPKNFNVQKAGALMVE